MQMKEAHLIRRSIAFPSLRSNQPFATNKTQSLNNKQFISTPHGPCRDFIPANIHRKNHVVLTELQTRRFPRIQIIHHHTSVLYSSQIPSIPHPIRCTQTEDSAERTARCRDTARLRVPPGMERNSIEYAKNPLDLIVFETPDAEAMIRDREKHVLIVRRVLRAEATWKRGNWRYMGELEVEERMDWRQSPLSQSQMRLEGVKGEQLRKPKTVDRTAEKLRTARVERDAGDCVRMSKDGFFEVACVDGEKIDRFVTAAACDYRSTRVVSDACWKLRKCIENPHERTLFVGKGTQTHGFAVPNTSCLVIGAAREIL